jgi:hypothetical protein
MCAPCALCGKNANLRKSHIIPAFFASYLKETSATGYLRGAVSPNLRVQDSSKEELLCDECEGRFSVFERAFAENAFNPVQEDSFARLEYGPWLLPFLVSISWRVLVVEKGFLQKDAPHFTPVIERTIENWRQFLLGKRNQPGSEHHLFVFGGVPTEMKGEFHQKTLHYLLRGIDATTGFGNRTLFVYTKALRSLIFSPIVPRSPHGWTNTRVHAGCGCVISPQKMAMRGFWDFVNSRIEMCYEKPLSDKQQSKITASMLQSPEKALESESYKVHVATRRLLNGPEKATDI